MKKLKKTTIKNVLLLLVLLLPFVSIAQNRALTATVSRSAGGSGNFGPQNINDGVIGEYNTLVYGWIADAVLPNWLEFTWATAQTVNKIKFYHGDRPLNSTKVQYWDGAAFVDLLTHTRPAGAQESEVFIPTVTTTRIRLADVKNGGYNPNFREVEMYEVPFSFATPTVTSNSLCGGSELSVGYSMTGVIVIGSKISVELSNASGSFASPTVIGTYTAASVVQSPTGNITATIPANTTPGTGYRIRVTSDLPSLTSANNGSNIIVTEPFIPSVSIVSNDADNTICFGTNVTFTATPVNGGGAPMYQWKKNGINEGNPSTSNTYSNNTLVNGDVVSVEMVSNNGCTSKAPVASNNITTTVNTIVASISSQTNVSCNGSSNGSATVAVSSGAGDYTYSWSPSGGTGATASGLTAGIYTVTVTDAMSCQTTVQVTITEPDALSATTSQTDVTTTLGSNGSATVNVTGGTGSYTYSWSPSGGTGATATGLASGNYTVTATDENGCIISRSFLILEPASITGFSAITKTYGDADFSISNPTSNSQGAFTYSSSNTSIATVTGNTVSILKPGTVTITATQAASGKYIETTATTTLIINKKALTITANDRTKVYGEVVTFAGNEFTPIGLINGHTVTSVSLSSTGAAATATVADSTYPIVSSAAQGTGLDNYNISYVDGSLTVTPKALVIANTNRSKVYGEVLGNADFAGSITGIENGDDITVIRTSTGSEATATVASSPYPIVATLVDPDNKLGNYTVTNPNGVLTVTPKALAIANTNRSKVYGQVLGNTDFTGSITGIENGDDITVTRTSTGAAATATVAGSPYPIVATLVDPDNKLGNYTITSPNGVLTVTPKALVIANTDRSKVYGQVLGNADFAGSITGIENNDNITATRTSTGAAATATVAGSPYPIVATLVDPDNKLGNYTVTNPNGVLTVTKKDLIIASTNRSKVYGEVLGNADFAGSITGIENGDNITVTRASTGSVATATVAGSPYPIVATLADPDNKLGNYTVTNPNGVLTVTKKDLMITADNRSKIYGETVTFAGTEFTTSGLVNGHTVTEVALTSAGAAATATVAGSAYPIVASAAQGTGLDNYDITYTNGALTVTPKDLVILANNIGKTYGETYKFYGIEFSVEGLVNGDKVNNAVVSSEGAGATARADGSPYAVIPSRAMGEGLDNYAIIYKNGELTVYQKALTISANSISKVYGETVSLTGAEFDASGLANGDMFTKADISSVGAPAKAVPGDYPILISNATGVDLSNYIATYVNGSLTVGKKDLIVKADNKEKFVGSANPALTLSYSGFVNNETTAVLTAQAVASTTATMSSPIGAYDITVSGGAAANYNLVYQKGTLTVKAGAPTDIALAAVALYENRPAGTTAGTLSSSSPDGSATFTYSLVTGTGSADNGLFAIDGNMVKTTASLNYEQKSSYSIRVKSTANSGLSLEKVITISLNDVNEAPQLAVIADQTHCYTTTEQVIQLTGISGGPEAGQTATLSVSTSNDNLFESVVLARTGDDSGTLTYKLKPGAAGSATVMIVVKDNGGTANGGEDSFARTFNILVNSLPSLSISSDLGLTIKKGQPAKLTATGGTTYVWANAEGVLSGQNTAVLTVRPSKTTTYTVTGSNASGCSQTASITITVTEDAELELVKATNIMSPNGDGKNDAWVIENLDLYPNNVVKIFDRGGRVVYEKKAYDNTWDATLNGAPLAEGTYYYVIEFGSDTRKIKKGFITIIRED